jgi:nucleotidyltransferase substrate binding protein (TIGR01987 family)
MEPQVTLHLLSLQKAVRQLAKSLKYYHSETAQKDYDLQEQFVAATIQAFEFTYELSTKYLRRYLSLTEPNAEAVTQMSFPDLIRTASERGLLQNDWSKWIDYRAKRNITSHTYDEDKANEVMRIVPEFLDEIVYLIAKLEERIQAS